MLDVARWLAEQGLGHHAEAFAENGIAGDVLRDLTDADLKELGLNLGDRKRLLKAIAALNAAPTRDQGEPPEQTTIPATPREAERRQLTVMFVDLVGSTALSAKLDPEDMREVIGAYHNRVTAEVTRFEGHIAKYMGDGVLAYFGWPRAHEDEAERAVRAGLAVLAAVASLRAPGGEPLAARIGVATGLVVVGDLVGQGAAREEAVVGDTPNLAARLQALATPGQVVIAETTRRLLGASFALEDLGERELKGISEPVQAFAVMGDRPTESRFEAHVGSRLLPMVGRDQELALLLERWSLAKAGEGQGVLLVGEAGIGKSRICRALLDALAAEPHVRLRYQCSPFHTDSALWPVIQQLSHAARFAALDSVGAKLDKLEALLARAGGGAAGAAPLIASLIGLDSAARYGKLDLAPQAQRARTLEALVDQLLGLAAREPVLVVLEDAHWIDPTTLEMIAQALDRIADQRVLILLTSRPDQQPELAGHPHVTRLSLNRLGRGGVEAIVARLGGDHLPSATVGTIIAQTDGVPLFVEELTKAILETGETTIPASLHDSLMARLDRIPEVKEVAQTAACIGRDFGFALLAAVVDRSEAELRSSLAKLAVAELIFRRGAGSDTRYTFKHALVRDAAYISLLRSRRRQLHHRIAHALEDRFPETAEAVPELVAHHFSEAELPEPAVKHWRKAGMRARQRSAELEAVRHLTRAVALMRSLPENSERDELEFELCIELGGALIATRGYGAPECRSLFARASELSSRLGDSSKIFPVLYGQWVYEHVNGRFTISLGIAEQFLRRAEQVADPALEMIGNRLLGFTLLMRGQADLALSHLRRSLAAYDPARHAKLAYVYGQNPRIVPLVGAGLALRHLGYPDQAARMVQEAVDDARSLSHFNTLAWALCYGGFFHLLQRTLPRAEALAAELVELAQEHGAVFWGVMGRIILSCARAAQSESAESLAQLRRDREAAHAVAWGVFRPGIDLLIAELLAQSGDVAAASRLLDEIEPFIEQWEQRLFEAELHRVRAELLPGSATEEAGAILIHAIDVARRQNAKALELRAARSLAEIWRDQGRRAKARDLLAPVYDWFTEGLDTADLKEARALLDDLA